MRDLLTYLDGGERDRDRDRDLDLESLDLDLESLESLPTGPIGAFGSESRLLDREFIPGKA